MSSNLHNPFEPGMQEGGQEDQWISLSDLMTGLMMIFMLIAITFMIKVQADANASLEKEKQSAASEAETQRIIFEELDRESKRAEEEARKVKQVAVIYDEIRSSLYNDLHREFDPNLKEWGAEITKDLSMRFNDPEVLFNTGKDELKPKFQNILQDFFPRYVALITSPKYIGSIKEIRIEGHTSKAWGASVSFEDAYYKNMELSQSRTRSTLRFVLGLSQIHTQAEWLRKFMTANGLSSSQPITNPDGSEDAVRSQRVEFHIRTDAESRIATILETAAPPAAGVAPK